MKSLLLASATALVLALPLPSALAATPNDQLVIGLSMSNVLTLDPAATTGREGMAVVNNVYDTLIRLDAVERTTVHPALAESWQISEDGSQITFQLREGATFASGNPVTVEDVLWSFRRVLSLELSGAGPWAVAGYTVDNFDELVTAQGNTITVQLAQPGDPQLLLYMFGKPSNTAIIDSRTALENEVDGDLAAAWLTTNSAGSGPYVVRSWNANDTIILDRFDGHWGGEAPMRRVLIRHMPESQTKRLMLERGDLDVGLGLSVPDISALSTNPDVVVQSTPSSGFYYLGVNMKDERFANRDVRLALRHLIDYQGINTTIMPNYGVLHQRPLSPGVVGSLPDPGYELDVEKAKEHLAAAGYPDGFTVELLSLNEPPFLDAATSIQGTLAQAGIRANIVTGTGNQVYGPMRERTFQMIVRRGGGGAEPHPHSNLQALAINIDNSDEAEHLAGGIVWRTAWQSEELNEMAAAALLERDPQAQQKMYEDIQLLYEEVVPALQPFSAVVDTVVFRADIEGYQNHYGWTTRFDGVSKDR
ncbi:ABC transporter substrate-binding protein [Devosia geojensis]|uniref:ABC transporter substrate-binding protein n=1 Tax=Devosia geojensis TaxID=443610 RepID=A0A0F5FDT4_9HYPH|nr:ABC transporter substrate-binding protein [Devosia geojensis]KKB06735.1 ABC transporter substrate-binding protein [Devosia geojensis]